MAPRDWTALGLRLIGVYVLLTVLRNLVDVVAVKMDWWELDPEYVRYYLLRIAVDSVVGLALVRKAESLSNFLVGTGSTAGTVPEHDATPGEGASLDPPDER